MHHLIIRTASTKYSVHWIVNQLKKSYLSVLYDDEYLDILLLMGVLLKTLYIQLCYYGAKVFPSSSAAKSVGLSQSSALCVWDTVSWSFFSSSSAHSQLSLQHNALAIRRCSLKEVALNHRAFKPAFYSQVQIFNYYSFDLSLRIFFFLDSSFSRRW